MRRFLFLVFIFIQGLINAQVLIDDAKTSDETPDANAVLELRSTTKGLLLPRLSTSVINAMQEVQAGTIVFDKETKEFKAFNGTEWIVLNGSETGGGNNGGGKGGETPPQSGELLTETFDGVPGNNTSSQGANSEWDGNNNFPNKNKDGSPNNKKVYQAGGAVKLGSGSSNGFIISKELNFENKPITITFDVKGWSKIEGDIIVSIDDVSKTVQYTNKRSDDFETKSVVFDGISGKAKVKIATSSKRAYLDNIHIVQ